MGLNVAGVGATCVHCRHKGRDDNINKYCKKDFAIQARVLSKETIGEWVKFTVDIINIFKREKDKIRRGEELIWVPLVDLDCKCPRLKLQKTYLLMSNDVFSTTRVGVIVDRNSIVMKWTDMVGKGLKQVMRAQSQGLRC